MLLSTRPYRLLRFGQSWLAWLEYLYPVSCRRHNASLLPTARTRPHVSRLSIQYIKFTQKIFKIKSLQCHHVLGNPIKLGKSKHVFPMFHMKGRMFKTCLDSLQLFSCMQHLDMSSSFFSFDCCGCHCCCCHQPSLQISPFCKSGNWASKRPNDFPKVPQLVANLRLEC